MIALGIIVLLLIVVFVYTSGRKPAAAAPPASSAAQAEVTLHNGGKPKAMSRRSLASIIRSIYNKLTGADAKAIPSHCLNRAHTELDSLVKFAAEDDIEKDMLMLHGKSNIEVLRETGDLEKSAELDKSPHSLLQSIVYKLRKLEDRVLGGHVEYVNLDFAEPLLPGVDFPDLIVVETSLYDYDMPYAAIKDTPLGSELVEPMVSQKTDKHQYFRGEQYERSGFANDERRVTPLYSVPTRNGYVGNQEKLYNSLLKFQQVREGH
jgi:hypothetical protein